MVLGRKEKREIRRLFKMKKEDRETMLRDRLTDYYTDLNYRDLGFKIEDNPLLEYEAMLFKVEPDKEEIERRITYGWL